MASYAWNVTDPSLIKQMKSAKVGDVFNSPAFSLCNFRWYLELYPNGQSTHPGEVLLFLYLAALSPKLHSLRIRRIYTFLQSGLKHDLVDTITREKMMAYGCPSGSLKTEDFLKYNQFEFGIKVDLLAVFDKNEDDITNQFLQHNETKTESNEPLNIVKLESLVTQLATLSATVQKMQLRMNEEEKNNDEDRLNKMEKKLNLIEQNVNKLMININIDPEQQKLKQWLEKQVKLPQYYQVFIDGGIDDLETAALITKDVLKDIGIDKAGHQIKILNHAKTLNVNEGTTSYI